MGICKQNKTNKYIQFFFFLKKRTYVGEEKRTSNRPGVIRNNSLRESKSNLIVFSIGCVCVCIYIYLSVLFLIPCTTVQTITISFVNFLLIFFFLISNTIFFFLFSKIKY